MNTEQARRLITLHDNSERALDNLRNAGAMSTDDPRATQLLEEAGDAYAEATTTLFLEQAAVVEGRQGAAERRGSRVTGPDWSAPGKGVQIIPGEGSGAGFVADNVEGIAEGNVGVRLTTDAAFRGEQFPEGATISVPRYCLTPADPAPDPETASAGSKQGEAPATA